MPVRGSDEESESGSKGATNVNGGVEVGNGGEKRWTNRRRVDGLTVLDLDVDDVVDREEVKDTVARVECAIAVERIGHNTNPDNDRTPDLLVSVSIGDESNDVDGSPRNVLGDQQVPNLRTHVVVPDGVELAAEHATRLLEPAIGLLSLRHDPGRLIASRTVDQLRGSRGDARIIKHGLGLGDLVASEVGGSTSRRVAVPNEFRRKH